jgi:hypothetical protein
MPSSDTSHIDTEFWYLSQVLSPERLIQNHIKKIINVSHDSSSWAKLSEPEPGLEPACELICALVY